MEAASRLLALGFVLIGRLTFLRAIPRSRWLSAAGGVAVAYVFLHVLPELDEGQARVRELEAPPPATDTFTSSHSPAWRRSTASRA